MTGAEIIANMDINNKLLLVYPGLGNVYTEWGGFSEVPSLRCCSTVKTNCKLSQQCWGITLLNVGHQPVERLAMPVSIRRAERERNQMITEKSIPLVVPIFLTASTCLWNYCSHECRRKKVVRNRII